MLLMCTHTTQPEFSNARTEKTKDNQEEIGLLIGESIESEYGNKDIMEGI